MSHYNRTLELLMQFVLWALEILFVTEAFVCWLWARCWAFLFNDLSFSR